MNRSDIVKAIANQCNLSQKNVDVVVDLFVKTIKLSLECEEDVLISGFGKFSIRERKSVTKTNPKTGEKITVPSKTTFIFSPSRVFKNGITKVTETNLEQEEDPAEKVQ